MNRNGSGKKTASKSDVLWSQWKQESSSRHQFRKQWQHGLIETKSGKSQRDDTDLPALDKPSEDNRSSSPIDLLGAVSPLWNWKGEKTTQVYEERVWFDGTASDPNDHVELADLDDDIEQDNDPQTDALIQKLGALEIDTKEYNDWIAEQVRLKRSKFRTAEDQVMMEEYLKGVLGNARLICQSRERRKQEEVQQRKIPTVASPQTSAGLMTATNTPVVTSTISGKQERKYDSDGDCVMGTNRIDTQGFAIPQEKAMHPVGSTEKSMNTVVGQKSMNPVVGLETSMNTVVGQKSVNPIVRLEKSMNPIVSPSAVASTTVRSGTVGISANPGRPKMVVVPFVSTPITNTHQSKRERSKMPDLFSL